MDRVRLTKVAKIVNELDKIADEVQSDNSRIALHLDNVSDMVEKIAFTPQGWMPGRGMGPGRGHGYGMGWNPGVRVKMVSPDSDPDAGGLMVCPMCGCRRTLRKLRHPMACTKCGSQMRREY